MPGRPFYHCCFLALCLLGIGAMPGAISAATSVAPGSVADLPLKLPPRSINDITRMLDDYRQTPERIDALRAVADAPVPAGADRAALFEFYWRRGQAAVELARIQQQIADFRMAIDNGRPNTSEYARALRDLGNAEVLGGNYLDALRYADESVRNIPKSATGQLTGAYAMKVALSAQVGDLETAAKDLAQLEATLTTLKSSRNWMLLSHSWLANYERSRGEYFRQAGKFVEADAAYRKALQESEAFIVDIPVARQSVPDLPTVDAMRRQIEGIERGLAAALLGQGKLVEAEAMARRAIEHTLRRAGRASPDVARGLQMLARALAEQGRYAESAKLSEAALQVMLESGAAADAMPVLTAYKTNVAIQVALGNDARALEINGKLRELVAGKPDLAAKVLRGDLDLVLAYLRTGQAKAAEAMASPMLETARRQFGEDSLRHAEILAFLAMAQADLGRSEEALRGFRRAIPPLVDQVRNDSEGETGSARFQQRVVVVIERYIRLLAELQQKKLVPTGVDPANEAFLLADFARGSSVQRALTRSAARAAIKDPGLADLARQEQDAQRRINSLGELLTQLLAAPPEQQLPGIQAQIRVDIEALKKSREKFKKEIGERFPEYARLVDPPPVNLDKVQKMLQPGEVLVTWYFSDHGGLVWAVRADGRRLFAPLPATRASVGAGVEQLRKALNPDVVTVDQIPPFDVALAHRLYRELLAPASDLLKDARVLLAVPHGELGQLPLSLLLSDAAAQPGSGAAAFADYRALPWLMRQVAIAQLPSVTALASLRQLPAGAAGRQPFIGFGDPLFSEDQARQAERPAPAAQVAMRGLPLRLRNVPRTQLVDSAELALLPRLPDTAAEIRDIALALGADPARDLYLNRAASEKSVFSTDLSNRRVVMFATHGLVPGELDGLTQPALALTAPALAGGEGDGLLTQEEILSLKLNADWVVLSACNTAAGEGAGSEAVSGLGRAFFYAGARALLVSNWPVETEAARSLMTGLFRRQVAGALGKAESLRAAMVDMVDGPGRLDAKTGKSLFSYAHPLFWAPFVLVGD